jgi:hypothetical protein
MAIIYAPEEKATEVEEHILAMHPTTEKDSCVKTNSHVIYSSRLFNVELEQHL